jgi:hypothetical protein
MGKSFTEYQGKGFGREMNSLPVRWTLTREFGDLGV